MRTSPGQNSALQVGVLEVGIVQHGPVHQHVTNVRILQGKKEL